MSLRNATEQNATEQSAAQQAASGLRHKLLVRLGGLASRLSDSPAPLVFLLPLLIVATWVAPDYDLQRLAKFLIFAILALGLDFLAGRGHLVSLGQAGFFAIGAYSFALLAGSCDSAPLLSLAVGMGAAGLIAGGFACLAGIAALRTRGVYFLMVTLALGQMVFYGLHDIPLFGGSDGIFVCAAPYAIDALNLSAPRVYYLITLASFACAVLLFWQLRRSFFGTLLGASATAEVRLAALGYAVLPIRLVAFTLVAATAGYAGALEAMRFRFVNPELGTWHLSGLLLVMVILGGRNRLWGSVLGAALVIGLEDLLVYWFPDHWQIGIGVLAVLVALFLPNGVVLFARQLALYRFGGWFRRSAERVH